MTEQNTQMEKVLVLGAGMVGRVIAQDIARDPGTIVHVADHDRKVLDAVSGQVHGTHTMDLTGDNTEFFKDYDIIVGAMPSHLAYDVTKQVIASKTHMVDISFSPKTYGPLGPSIEEAGIAVVPDMGVAPGMSNLLVGHCIQQLGNFVDTVKVMVGGIPVTRTYPHQYKAAFSPADVLEEYTRDVYMRVGGKNVVREALSEPELVEFGDLGTLEAFNTDGLRTLLDSFPFVPDMVEKTLRWPGHRDLMKVLKDMGFFSTVPKDTHYSGLGGGWVDVIPRDLTCALLFPQWQYKGQEQDITAMRVEVSSQDTTHKWEMMNVGSADRVTSMARTTAIPAAAVARLIQSGKIGPGLHTPEDLGASPELTQAILDDQARRGIHYQHTVI